MLSPSSRAGVILLNLDAFSVERLRRGLQDSGASLAAHQRHRHRRLVGRDVDEHVGAEIGIVIAAERLDTDGCVRGKPAISVVVQPLGAARRAQDARAHIVEHLQDDAAANFDPILQCAAWRGLEDQFEVAIAREKFVELDRHQRSRGDDAFADAPVLLGADIEIVAMQRGRDLLGQVELDARAAFGLDENLQIA